MFFLTGSRIFGRGKGVRMSMLVSADAKSMPLAVHTFGVGTRVLNALLGSDVRFQHLPVPFELYSDGIDLPVFEEFGAGTAALHLRDQLQRNELLADKDYRRRFRREFDRVKLGPSLWERNFRWPTTVPNHRPKQLDKLAADPSIHMGFSDAGAHLRNMAFYNFGLRLLKRARDAHRAGTPFLSTQRAVHRLTGELGEWFGIDAGTLREGDRADFGVIDPAGLNESADGYYAEDVTF